MNDKQRIARTAFFSLKEVVLEVLYEARDEGRLQPEVISGRLGIRRCETAEHQYGLVRSILFLLNDEKYGDGNIKYVDHVTNEGWKITPEAISLLSAGEQGGVT